MAHKISRKVPQGQPLFPARPPLSQQELSRRKADNEMINKQGREIFSKIYPELVKEHYNWAIIVEPVSGDYFIDLDPEIAFQKARAKHPTAIVLEMRLNETGSCGRI